MEYSSKISNVLGTISLQGRNNCMLNSLRKFSESEVAQERQKIIEFYGEHGEEETKKFFKVNRQLISVWKKRLNLTSGRLIGLIPSSTKPKHNRKSDVNPDIIEEIRKQREAHYRLGKEKLKSPIDKFCRFEGLPLISESTIGRIVKDNHFFFQPKLTGKIYHNPDSKWARGEAKKKKRLRVRRCPHYQEEGHIQFDTVETIVDGIKTHFFCAIDTYMKFALCLNYKSQTSKNSTDFYHKFKTVYPTRIIDWQNDNGHENLKFLEKELTNEKIQQLFSYPHCPQVNGYVERFNRTIQDEFINPNIDFIWDTETFNKKLAEYNIWYNCERPHKSLGKKSPMDFFILKKGMSNMCWTYTKI